MWNFGLKNAERNTLMLTTERLHLRPAHMDDYMQWRYVRAKNESFLKPYEPSWPDQCLTESFFKRRVERLCADWDSDKTYAFVAFANGQLIGGINLNNVARGAAQYASLGYWLDEDHQGKGYMHESAAAVLDFAYNVILLERVNAATLVHNERSRKMLQRLGFEEEGFARNYIQIDGRRQDHVLYGLTKERFSGAARKS